MPKLLLISLIILLQITYIMSVSKMDLILSEKTLKTPAVSAALAPGIAPAGMVHIRVVTTHSGGDAAAAGGDVILGGFAVALVAAVVCYIRATRKTVIHQSVLDH
ncbi:hypothetical protein vseg_011325 [Gypsophila vaccaria]